MYKEEIMLIARMPVRLVARVLPARRHLAYRLLPTLMFAAALNGGDALAGSPEYDPSNVDSGAVSANNSAEAVHAAKPAASPVSLNLHVFGLSYHPDREGTRVNHLDNELNIGLGLNYEFSNDARGIASLESGFYRDSGRNWAKFAGVGYQFKLDDRWRLGANLLAIQSQTYNKGNLFVAPIPVITYDFGVVKLNATYIPRVSQFNEFAVYAIYFTAPLKSW
jgi:hypothetical protein